jgi:hypothetical protein
MSTAPAPAPATVVPQPVVPSEVVIISHSTLFYWWPLWVVGYAMALITLFHDQRMATVPAGTKLVSKATGQVEAAKADKAEAVKEQDVLLAPEGTRITHAPTLHISAHNSLGVTFAIVFLLVVIITNVPLRGLWSVIVIVVIILMSVIFALTGVWETILTGLSWLDIRINMGGYLFISTALLIVWLFVFFVFDRQVYMVFTPGNLRVQLEIGDGETTYDTTGMTVQKQRSDLFRHWILGLGSGDLIVQTSGAQMHKFDLPNVLAIGRRVREIEELLRTKQVVAAHEPPRH